VTCNSSSLNIITCLASWINPIRNCCVLYNCYLCIITLYCCDRKSPNGMCAKLHTVTASNNRVHMTWSHYYCLFTPRICGVVLRAHSIPDEPCILRNASGVVATVPHAISCKTSTSSLKDQNADIRNTFGGKNATRFNRDAEIPNSVCSFKLTQSVSVSVYLGTTINKQQIMPQKTNHIRTAFILFPGHLKQPYGFLVRCPDK